MFHFLMRSVSLKYVIAVVRRRKMLPFLRISSFSTSQWHSTGFLSIEMRGWHTPVEKCSTFSGGRTHWITASRLPLDTGSILKLPCRLMKRSDVSSGQFVRTPFHGVFLLVFFMSSMHIRGGRRRDDTGERHLGRPRFHADRSCSGSLECVHPTHLHLINASDRLCHLPPTILHGRHVWCILFLISSPATCIRNRLCHGKRRTFFIPVQAEIMPSDVLQAARHIGEERGNVIMTPNKQLDHLLSNDFIDAKIPHAALCRHSTVPACTLHAVPFLHRQR